MHPYMRPSMRLSMQSSMHASSPLGPLSTRRALVRDCSWHPYEPELTSVSWDGRVVRWTNDASAPRSKLAPKDDQMYDDW